ncbi:MAG TPA: HEAT repeat domain-containing protein [Pirellulales bacterium]|nr:HEAT repeat domain-containing protein [Pirellulales bacterium]
MLATFAARSESFAQPPADGETPPAATSGQASLRYARRTFADWAEQLETDLHPATRIEAIEALERFGAHGYAEEALPRIARALDDDSPRVRLAAAVALAQVRVGGTDAPNRLADCRRAVLEALRRWSPRRRAAVPPLVAALRTDAARIRAAALEVLAEMGPAAELALPDVLAAVGDRDPGVRLHACRAAGNIGKFTAAMEPALLAALRDEEPSVRLAAGTSLGRLGPAKESVVEALKRAMHDESELVRRGLARAFATMADNAETIVPALIEAVALAGQANPDVELALLAIEAIAVLGPKAEAAAPALVGLFGPRQPNAELHRPAIVALGKIGPAAAEAAPILAELADPRSPRRAENLGDVALAALKSIERR